MCRLDLAPEAPWRCPEDCPSYQRKMIDAGWVQGSLANKPTPGEPAALNEDAVRLLDEAEDIINKIGPGTIAEVSAERDAQRAKPKRKWWPFGHK